MKESKTKRIRFDNLSSPISFIIVVGAFVCFIIGWIYYGFESNLFQFSGFVLMTIFLGKGLVFPRYVGWNKKGMQLRFGWNITNSFSDSISFNTIRDVIIDDGIMILVRLDGKVNEYDVSEIVEEDIQRLESLINRCAQLSKTISVAEN